jgi:hypothetical protein
MAREKYLTPEHIYTPRRTRMDIFGQSTPSAFNERKQPALMADDECIHCVATKNNPRSASTYLYRFSPNAHPFTYIIQEQP